MRGLKTKSLSKGHQQAAMSDDHAPVTHPLSYSVQDYYNKHQTLKDKNIAPETIRKAWFTMAHLMLRKGARVVDMGCENGAMTYVMAALHPDLEFIGIDYSAKKIKAAQKEFQLDNLRYEHARIDSPTSLEEESVDAIINSFILYEIFSQAKYNEQAVMRALENQFKALKIGGMMFVRDYAMPPPGSYVQLEMPDTTSRGPDLKSLSEPDLLVWYAEHARPGGEPGCNGFFLEELPARFPQTRLFRLPYKWAYEFMMRKDDRRNWAQDLPKEYTFFTQREYRRNLRSLGARVLYTAPHWDEQMIREKFDSSFRLYDDNGQPMSAPPTSFIALAQKRAERDSLCLHERRPSSKTSGHIKITSMRDDVSGKLVDIISRDIDVTDVLPYRLGDDGKLYIYLREDVPRALTNAVPRMGDSIDGKRWSGHMCEAVTVPSSIIAGMSADDYKQTLHFSQDYLGLRAALQCGLEDGPSYFPAPDKIDEMVRTKYLRVTDINATRQPKRRSNDAQGFDGTGTVREFSAEQIMDAINVGLIPSAKLELQIQYLIDMLGVEQTSWLDTPLSFRPSDRDLKQLNRKDFARQMTEQDNRFRNVRGSAGDLRLLSSTFIDEGWVDGGITGLAAQNMDFVVGSEQTPSKVCVLPLHLSLENKLHVGFVTEYTPIPQRHKGNGKTIMAPTFDLPKEVKTVSDAKKYVAKLFDISVDNVWRLGEGFYEHIDVTPQRLFTFAITDPPSEHPVEGGPIEYAPMEWIWSIIWINWDWNASMTFVWAARKASRDLGQDSDLSHKVGLSRSMLKADNAPGITKMSHATGFNAIEAPSDGGTPSALSGEPADPGISAPTSEHTPPEAGEATDAATSIAPVVPVATPQKKAVRKAKNPDLKNLKIYDKKGDQAWRPGEADFVDSQNTQESYNYRHETRKTKEPSQDQSNKPKNDDA